MTLILFLVSLFILSHLIFFLTFQYHKYRLNHNHISRYNLNKGQNVQSTIYSPLSPKLCVRLILLLLVSFTIAWIEFDWTREIRDLLKLFEGTLTMRVILKIWMCPLLLQNRFKLNRKHSFSHLSVLCNQTYSR